MRFFKIVPDSDNARQVLLNVVSLLRHIACFVFHYCHSTKDLTTWFSAESDTSSFNCTRVNGKYSEQDLLFTMFSQSFLLSNLKTSVYPRTWRLTSERSQRGSGNPDCIWVRAPELSLTVWHLKLAGRVYFARILNLKHNERLFLCRYSFSDTIRGLAVLYETWIDIAYRWMLLRMISWTPVYTRHWHLPGVCIKLTKASRTKWNEW